MERFKTLSESKFNKLTDKDMQSVVGGFLCISCKKRARKVEFGFNIKAHEAIPGSPTEK